MTPCEQNCFCNCDGSCHEAAPTFAENVAIQFVRKKFGVTDGRLAVKSLFPEGVPDFTQDACAQRDGKIT